LLRLLWCDFTDLLANGTKMETHAKLITSSPHGERACQTMILRAKPALLIQYQ